KPSRLTEDRGRIDQRADRDEEEHREEIAKRKHLASRLLRFGADREEETRNERAEREWHPEQGRADAGGGEGRRDRDDEESVLLAAHGSQKTRHDEVLHSSSASHDGDRLAERDRRRRGLAWSDKHRE